MKGITDNMEIKLGKLLDVLVRKWWIVVLAAVVAAGLANRYTYYYITPVYAASTTLYVKNSSSSDSSSVSAGELSASQALLNTYIVVLKSNTVLSKVADTVALGYSASQISSMISASSVNETEVLRITVYNSNPANAQIIANAIGQVAPDEIIRVVKAGSVEVIDKAALPNAPYSPNISYNTLIGGMIGLIASLIIIILTEIFHVKIKTEEDLHEISSLPIIGLIPEIEPVNPKGEKGNAGVQ